MKKLSKIMILMSFSMLASHTVQSITQLEQDIAREKEDEQLLALVQQTIATDKAKIVAETPAKIIEAPKSVAKPEQKRLSDDFIKQYSTGTPCKGIDENASNKKNGGGWIPDFNMMALLKISTKIQQEYPMLNNEGVKEATVRYIDNYDPKGENGTYIKGAKSKINNLVFKK